MNGVFIIGFVQKWRGMPLKLQKYNDDDGWLFNGAQRRLRFQPENGQKTIGQDDVQICGELEGTQGPLFQYMTIHT